MSISEYLIEIALASTAVMVEGTNPQVKGCIEIQTYICGIQTGSEDWRLQTGTKSAGTSL